MKKIFKQLKEKLNRFIKDEKGEFGIKEIAITLGVIILVGVAVAAITGLLPTWIEEIWEFLFGKIEELIS